MINKGVFLLFLVVSTSVFAQETILLKGRIKADSLDGSFINIINVTRETGTVNNISGNLEIEAGVNDTLLFFSVHYEVLKETISEEIFKNGFLVVELKQHINELDEVEISNISLSGNLQKDLLNIEIFDQSAVGFRYRTTKPMAPVERHLNTAKSNPLIYLLNTVNGRIKMLEKAREYELLAMMIDKGMDIMPVEFYTEDLELPEQEIINFVYFCAERPEFESLLGAAKRLELIEFYKKQAPLFLENRIGS